MLFFLQIGFDWIAAPRVGVECPPSSLQTEIFLGKSSRWENQDLSPRKGKLQRVSVRAVLLQDRSKRNAQAR
ncbi:MAG TPA: hypothetical protein VHA15_00860 [Burkholderiales bacterium]|jgi:hypothetical protein|nr:hypothetical protein [Burkholderiales bacterium]